METSSEKLQVAVVMGGKSAEHEISLISGGEVVKNLDNSKYGVLPVAISKDGRTWLHNQEKINPFTFFKDLKVDVAFIALHGPYGEDGCIQGLLEMLDVPYTGSGVLASALGMHKLYSNKIFTHSGLNIPNSATLKRGDSQDLVWQELKPPVFVKPATQGSSVGVSKVKAKVDLKKALDLAFSHSEEVIVDEFIDGTEITGAVIGNSTPRALPLVEIVPKKEFFDYEAKYTESLTDEIVPARISETLTQKAQAAAITAYKAIGCRGFGRVDMIIRGDKIYVLEVNTIPGLTPVSLFPKAAKEAGLSYTQLLDELISLALESSTSDN